MERRGGTRELGTKKGPAPEGWLCVLLDRHGLGLQLEYWLELNPQIRLDDMVVFFRLAIVGLFQDRAVQERRIQLFKASVVELDSRVVDCKVCIHSFKEGGQQCPPR